MLSPASETAAVVIPVSIGPLLREVEVGVGGATPVPAWLA